MIRVETFQQGTHRPQRSGLTVMSTDRIEIRMVGVE
jgi:hypothetical protein